LQNPAIHGQQWHSLNLGQGHKLAIVGCATGRCYELQNSIGGHRKFTTFKSCFGFPGDLFGRFDRECLLSDRRSQLLLEPISKNDSLKAPDSTR
jgi:hypothetical protein